MGTGLMVKRKGRHPRNDLDAKKVASLVRKRAAGRHFDGGGLHLLVKPDGGASWVLRVAMPGKRNASGNPVRRDYGLGGVDSVSLADAREKARQWRTLVKAGGDPVAEKARARIAPTFEAVAREVHSGHSASWRNPKHRAQWLSTLEMYAFPEIGKMPVDQIEVPDILRVLSPIWLAKQETARRLRQRLRVVFDVARAGGHRPAENPVGPMLSKALPRQTGAPRHHAAMPYADLPRFFARLGEDDAGGEVSRLALRFLILTAARSGEVRGARRSEINLEAAEWVVPAERMKMGREHRVPLSAEAVSILRRALELATDEELIFGGARVGKPLSDMALLMCCRRLGVGVVPHGFRSSFSDWTAEQTSFPAEVREMALAHAIGSKTEAAYRRGDLLEKRRKLMDEWAGFATGATGKLVAIRASARR